MGQWGRRQKLKWEEKKKKKGRGRFLSRARACSSGLHAGVILPLIFRLSLPPAPLLRPTRMPGSIPSCLATVNEPTGRLKRRTQFGGVIVRQFSHYVIFFIAIFTVLQLVVLGASTYPIKRRWDGAAYKSKEEVREMEGEPGRRGRLYGSFSLC